MPILTRHRWVYPIDWRELALSIRFRCAKDRCESCSRPNGRDVVHLGDGRWWDEDARTWRCGAGERHQRLRPPFGDARAAWAHYACHAGYLDPANNDAGYRR